MKQESLLFLVVALFLILRKLIILVMRKENMEDKQMEKEMKYPRQVMRIGRADKILGANQYFYANEDTPMSMHSGYSKAELSILNIKEKQSVVANIPATELSLLMEKTRIATEKLMSLSQTGMELNTTMDEKYKEVYTLTLISKDFKGKTVAEVLKKNPENRSKLLQDKEFLLKNLEKYPNNRKLVKAIDLGIQLLDSGVLFHQEAVQEKNEEKLVLYAPPIKFKRKKDARDGFNQIYQICITCSLEAKKEYPYLIQILNAYAPVEQTENGSKIILGKARDKVSNYIYLTENEWFSLISRLDENRKLFEQMIYAQCFSVMEKYCWIPNQ